MAEKKEGDSLRWVVEQQLAKLQGLVAISHAKRGNQTVMMTSRKISDGDMDELADAGVTVKNARDGR